MKSNRFILILLMAALVAGTSSFFVTRARICGPCNQSCQTKTFKAETLRLADMLEAETSSHDQIIDQARKVFAIRQSNIIAAARHALKTDTGRQTILDMLPCPADSNQTKTGSCCAGPGCCCKFNSGQSQKLAQSDPNFLKACAGSKSETNRIRQSLVSMLNDRSVSDEKIIDAIQDYLERNNILEIRAIEYFIAIRPHLTVEQRKQIFCWCAGQLRSQAEPCSVSHN
jgi:hypothetical protein